MDQNQVGIVIGMVLIVLIKPVQILYKLHTITALVYLINAQWIMEGLLVKH